MKASFIFAGLALALAASLSGAEPAAKPDSQGFIRNWLMLAPIYLDEDTPGYALLDEDQIEDEAALQPGADEETRIRGERFVWQSVQTTNHVFDFVQTLGYPVNMVAGYLVTYVDCSRELTGLNLLVGHNDEGLVYLNGNEVFRFETATSLTPDSGRVENVTLKKGVNTIVFKVINEANAWQACLRFTDKDGKPVTGYSVKSAP